MTADALSNAEAAETQPSTASIPFSVRKAVLLVGLVPLAPQIVGSIFNIWYNASLLEPTLSPAQSRRFMATITAFNVSVYPLATVLWIMILLTVQRGFGRILRGERVAPYMLELARRRAINLPWWMACIGSGAWLACIPTFLAALEFGPESLSPKAYMHLPISFLIGGSIATTQGFFLVELLSQRLIFPSLFKDASPSQTDGAAPLNLRGRGMMWAVAAGICPIASLVLLNLADASDEPGLALFVGGIGVIFCVLTAWLAGVLVETPVKALHAAAQHVAQGDLQVEIGLRRADDFGPLIEEFNHMVAGLRDKQHIEETFGRHMGSRAAERILQRNPGADGAAEDVTVMFADIRSFTTRSSQSSPQEIVRLLNRFFTCMVETIERHEGMVNKYLGDGLMALFDVSSDSGDGHADRAVHAALEMQRLLVPLNRELAEEGIEELAIGIGIHSGEAVVGSIGSPRRQEYTAIGDTVNCAARIQDMTKQYAPTLISDATLKRLRKRSHLKTTEYPACDIRGRDEAITLYGVTPNAGQPGEGAVARDG